MKHPFNVYSWEMGSRGRPKQGTGKGAFSRTQFFHPTNAFRIQGERIFVFRRLFSKNANFFDFILADDLGLQVFVGP